MDKPLEFLLGAIEKAHQLRDTKPEGDLLVVSETVSAAASVYETIRNSLEYDEEHLLRRNAIRRILKRKLGEVESAQLAGDLLRELIWARYLPNKSIPETKAGTLARILEKYQPLFSLATHTTKEGQRAHDWLLDVISTEVEYALSPPIIDEAVASFSYAQLKKRISWNSEVIGEDDRDLQLYVAVHRAVLKSNLATLRFRVFSLFHPDWVLDDGGKTGAIRTAEDLSGLIGQVERSIQHPGQDALYMIVRRHAIVFHVIRDVADENPRRFAELVASGNTGEIDSRITHFASDRYAMFRTRLRNSVIRAVLFLFITKMALALIIEFPYERFVLKTTNMTPLLVNIIFHPTLLGIIGLTARLPEAANTNAVIREAHAFLGLGDDVAFTYKMRRPWSGGALGFVFNAVYALMFLFTISVISTTLRHLDFNALSIFFFVFFLSLVTFFGLKIRNTRRELMVVEATSGIIGTIADVLFLPMIRAGRWVALRAPRVNVFIFFFDFIVEAPFKAAISMVEGWLAFLREKKEEI